MATSLHKTVVTYLTPSGPTSSSAEIFGAALPKPAQFSYKSLGDKKALATLARSFVDMKLLEAEPDMSRLYTEKFLPGAGG